MNRREFLYTTGGGFGGLALADLLVNTADAASGPALRDGRHHPAKAKRVIQLFMNGGVSPMDTFDYKPKLAALHGQKFDPGAGELVESVTGSAGFKVLKSPFEFQRHGRSGRWVSSVFPALSKQVDDLAFIQSMTSTTNVHGLGSYMQNTGFTLPGFPCMGSWISYALGRINQNLPEFIVMPDAKGLPYNNLGNFTSGFLPSKHRGTVIELGDDAPIPFLFPPPTATHITDASAEDGIGLIQRLNRAHADRYKKDEELQSRIASYELAARMQLSAPEAFDLSKETETTRRRYGVGAEPTDDFGKRLLTGRRLVERGVRFVQIWSGPGGPKNNWDNHANIESELPYMTQQVDQPIAALLEDLKARGLMEDTLVVWTTEFGRMPFSQGNGGRDHNGGTFVTWLAGAGIRGGATVGQSDPWGWKSVEPLWCYDLHATILHLLGIDHERLTVRHNGIERRLTDVHGRVLQEILA